MLCRQGNDYSATRGFQLQYSSCTQYRRPADTGRHDSAASTIAPSRPQSTTATPLRRLDHRRRRGRPIGALSPGALLLGYRRFRTPVGLWVGRSMTVAARTTPKKGVFACNIDLLYDLISSKLSTAARCRPSNRLLDVDDTKIWVKRACTAVFIHLMNYKSTAYDVDNFRWKTAMYRGRRQPAQYRPVQATVLGTNSRLRSDSKIFCSLARRKSRLLFSLSELFRDSVHLTT